MRISVIITNRNRSTQLNRCLKFLNNQKTSSKCSYEVIVVDSNSTDDSLNILNYYLSEMSNLHVFSIKQDEFNVSECRNFGAAKCRGDIITFLDVDMIVPDDFIEIMINKYKNKHENIVILHYIYGFRIRPGDELASTFNRFTSENLRCSVKSKIEYSDFRDSHTSLYKNNLSEMVAPWVFGWSGVITISKILFEKIEGFDIRFIGWGGEDIDLAYRLHKEGAIYTLEDDAFGVHVPHQASISSKKNQSVNNRKFLHSKHNTIETELYIILSGIALNNVLSIVEKFDISAISPIYSSEFLERINSILGESTRTLSVGMGSNQEIHRTNFSNYFVLNERAKNLIENIKPKSKVNICIGLQTKYENNFFDTVIIFDSYMFLPEKVRFDFYNEMCRISKKVYQIKTPNYSPPIFYSSSTKIDTSTTKNIIDIINS